MKGLGFLQRDKHADSLEKSVRKEKEADALTAQAMSLNGAVKHQSDELCAVINKLIKAFNFPIRAGKTK